MLLLFIYPFLYGLVAVVQAEGGRLARQLPHFFTTDNLWPTIWTTLQAGAAGDADQCRPRAADRLQDAREVALPALVTTILVVPITLGTVLIAEGMLTYFGPKGWLSQFLQLFHLYDGPIRLTHNYWGVLISLVISGFPFAFLLILSYITGIDPVLARAAATLGAEPRAQFRHIYLPLLAPGLAMCFCLAFVQAFSVFPSAVLLGSPAGPTRVISIAAYEAAFEQYDYSLASAIAMIMGFVQLVIVVAVLGLRNALYRGPVEAEARDERACGTSTACRADQRRGSTAPGRGLLWGLMTLFVVNIGLMIAAVATNSFARRWLGTWLPDGWTTNWYAAGVEGVPARRRAVGHRARWCSRWCSWRC